MTEKDAKKIGSKYLAKYQNIAVDSNGSVYLNADITAIKKSCKEQKLELFICKGYAGVNKTSEGSI